MRVRWAALGFLVAITACGSSPASDSTSATSRSSSVPSGSAALVACGPASARTLAADARARVYRVGSSVYGCAHGARRSHILGDAVSCVRSERAGPFALSGTVVAYGLEVCGVDTGSGQVVVERLSDGRRLRILPATTNQAGPESYQQVGSLVVKADGAVAWIGISRSIIRHTQVVEVHRADRRGQRELDAGSAIVTGSLRLHRSKLTWRDGGSTHSGTLL